MYKRPIFSASARFADGIDIEGIMPVYEYECEKCGTVSTFVEKMFEPPKLFFGRKKCPKCGGKKLHKVMSAFSAHAVKSYPDQLHELKRMGNVQFVPPPPKPAWGDGPPPGGCPYENAAKADEEKKKKIDDEKRRSPIILSGS